MPPHLLYDRWSKLNTKSITEWLSCCFQPVHDWFVTPLKIIPPCEKGCLSTFRRLHSICRQFLAFAFMTISRIVDIWASVRPAFVVDGQKLKMARSSRAGQRRTRTLPTPFWSTRSNVLSSFAGPACLCIAAAASCLLLSNSIFQLSLKGQLQFFFVQ